MGLFSSAVPSFLASSLLLLSCGTVQADPPAAGAGGPPAPARQSVEQAAQEMSAVLQAIARAAREPDADQKNKVELSALVQLQEKLILESQDDLESWTEEERSRYHRLLVESVGDSASLLGLVKKEEAVAAPPSARGPRDNPPGGNCICPFCEEYCGCPFVCVVITDPPKYCNNYYQWVYHLGLRRWERWICDPTGNFLPKCSAPGFVNCPG